MDKEERNYCIEIMPCRNGFIVSLQVDRGLVPAYSNTHVFESMTSLIAFIKCHFDWPEAQDG